MFDVWQLRRLQRKALRKFRESNRRLRANKDSKRIDYDELDSDEYSEINDIETQIDHILSNRLWHRATQLDIDIPSFKDTRIWQEHEDIQIPFLTTHGRFVLRRLIDEEKARRFEVTTRWIKLIGLTLVPVLSAAAGLVGAMIGWVAIHKK